MTAAQNPGGEHRTPLTLTYGAPGGASRGTVVEQRYAVWSAGQVWFLCTVPHEDASYVQQSGLPTRSLAMQVYSANASVLCQCKSVAASYGHSVDRQAQSLLNCICPKPRWFIFTTAHSTQVLVGLLKSGTMFCCLNIIIIITAAHLTPVKVASQIAILTLEQSSRVRSNMFAAARPLLRVPNSKPVLPIAGSNQSRQHPPSPKVPP